MQPDPQTQSPPGKVGSELKHALVKAQADSIADADEWDGPPEGGDIFTQTCPRCGSAAEWPDCGACGFAFSAPAGPDIAEAARFLAMIDASARTFRFRTFSDPDGAPKDAGHKYHGSFEQAADLLIKDNRARRGVFYVVNDGGDRDADIKRIRAVFADTDGAPLDPIMRCGLVPHVVVETSAGKWHAYWLVDGLPADQFRGIQRRIAYQFSTDRSVINESRVMRLPGFDHHKGEPFRACIVHESGLPAYSANEITEAFPPLAEFPDKASKSATAQGRAGASTAPRACTSGYLDAALRRAAENVASAAVGSRNNTLNKEAHSLAGYLDLSDADIIGALATAARAAGMDDGEIDATMRSGIAAGRAKPRDVPAKSRDVPARPVQAGAKTAPEPLRRPMPEPAPYPLDALGPVLADAAKTIRRVIQAPDAICGASALAAASLATQGLADVEHHGRIYPLSLWLLSVAESGDRKTAVDAETMRAAREFEKELGRDYQDALEVHRARLAEWELKQEAAKAAAKKNRGVGLADALLDIGPAPAPPLVAKVTVADFTAEGIAKLLIAGRPTIGAFADEAALVFGGHGMTKETVARTAGTLCKLWDSGSLDRIRAADGAVKLYGRRMAMHLMAQPVIAETALGDPLLSGQGFLARCLLAWPTSTAGSRPYVDESTRDDPALIALASRLGELHRLPLPVSPDDDQELAPRALTLTAGAADLWRRLHDAVEQGMAPGARFANCKAWASKTPEQCLRIAGVLTLIEDADARVVGEDAIERAADIALYHLNEAVRLAGTAALSPEVRDAEALLNWCHETARTELYSREALRLGPARIRDRETLNKAVKELVGAGWAEKIDGGKTLDGAHRRHVWTIKPASEGV